MSRYIISAEKDAYLSELILIVQAGLKIIELYMEGYRQDWGLSFQKDTVSKGGWYVTLSFINA